MLLWCDQDGMPLRRLVFLLLLSAPSSAMHAAASAPPPKPVVEILPYAVTASYAAQHGIALEGIPPPDASATPQSGDSVIYLLELQRGTAWRQWLVRLTADRPDPGQGDPASLPADTIYTSTGQALVYTHTPVALAVEFIGPFTNESNGAAKVATRRGRAVVSAESLELGLVRYCESSLPIADRLKAAGIAEPVYYGTGDKPKPDTIEAGQKAAAAFGLTPDEERLAFSVYFALRSFYQAASGITACREVLEEVIAKPSLWSVATNLGLNTSFNYGWHHVQSIPRDAVPLPSAAYLLPVTVGINTRFALKAAIIVTDTAPPLRTSAGIVAILAEHPEDPSRRVYLRLMSAQSGKR